PGKPATFPPTGHNHDAAQITSGPGDINTRIIFCGNNSGRAGEQAQVFLPYPLFIPAGHGIWASSGSFQAGAAPTGGLGLSWDFLG
ncbi:hypothetical protein AAIH39_17950, partial [Pseudomonas aeruginosa]|uniref:hypothetical protein n=1 Tax=Pseudomonas aeruginosa TaxID=287 RepID=UPI0031B726A6